MKFKHFVSKITNTCFQMCICSYKIMLMTRKNKKFNSFSISWVATGLIQGPLQNAFIVNTYHINLWANS